MWFYGRKSSCGFSGSSTAEEVTHGIDGTGLTAIVTGMFGYPFTLSQDNIEQQFPVNYLGHFLLTNLLMDTMKSTVLRSGKEGRVVNVSSLGHQYTYHEGILFDELNDPSRYSRCSAYGQSKLAKILLVKELAKQFKDEGVNITANAIHHPGIIYTNLNPLNAILSPMNIIKDIPQGAATTCYVALHPQVKGISGEYFINCNIAKPSKKAQGITLARKLWEFSMDLVK